MIWDFGSRFRGFASLTPHVVAMQVSPVAEPSTPAMPPETEPSPEPRSALAAEKGLSRKPDARVLGASHGAHHATGHGTGHGTGHAPGHGASLTGRKAAGDAGRR